MYGLMNPSLRILRSRRRSITRLRLMDFSANISFSELPALECLEMIYAMSTYQSITSIPPDNYVERLIFFTAVCPFNGAGESQLLAETDTLLSTCPMPALRQVELRIMGIYPSQFDLDSVKRNCPHLEAQGFLVVTDHRTQVLPTAIGVVAEIQFLHLIPRIVSSLFLCLLSSAFQIVDLGMQAEARSMRLPYGRILRRTLLSPISSTPPPDGRGFREVCLRYDYLVFGALRATPELRLAHAGDIEMKTNTSDEFSRRS
ncbi:hypothetical protein DFH09DRAFT_1424056 [Mycena vulgaris]|nr:hypothetical protein DFH09DRAFT_1424056 [Mycena vulgaris]